jgi:hypothetical protein
MSWNLSVTGKTREEAAAAVMADKNVAEWKYCPSGFAAGIALALGGLSQPRPGYQMRVETSGHVNPDGIGGDSVSGDVARFSVSYEPAK